MSRSTIKEYLARASAAELAWPLPAELTDAVLEERLFAAGGPKPGTRRRAEPDWTAPVREMKRPGVNLTVLWEEYGAAHPGGYGYSGFCELYREFDRGRENRLVSIPPPFEPDVRICRVAQPLLTFAPTEPTVRRYRSGLFRKDRRRGDHLCQA